MDESERLQRQKEYRCYHDSSDRDLDKEDQELSERIAALLNDSKIDKYCMVDAYYYDFSVIPRSIQEKLQLWRDAYLIFGITTEGEMISKWVDRWDLDSPDPIVDGKVMHGVKPRTEIITPEISNMFDPKLLSTPMPDLISNMFGEFNTLLR
jgi:hypothetical protein